MVDLLSQEVCENWFDQLVTFKTRDCQAGALNFVASGIEVFVFGFLRAWLKEVGQENCSRKALCRFGGSR